MITKNKKYCTHHAAGRSLIDFYHLQVLVEQRCRFDPEIEDYEFQLMYLDWDVFEGREFWAAEVRTDLTMYYIRECAEALNIVVEFSFDDKHDMSR